MTTYQLTFLDEDDDYVDEEVVDANLDLNAVVERALAQDDIAAVRITIL